MKTFWRIVIFSISFCILLSLQHKFFSIKLTEYGSAELNNLDVSKVSESVKASVWNYSKIMLDTLTKSKVDAARAVQEARFRGNNPIYNFVLVNGHRTSNRSFAVVGLGALTLQKSRVLSGCKWKSAGDGQEIDGILTANYPGEHHDLTYETALFFCLFPTQPVKSGGVLTIILNNEVYTAYHEEPNAYPVLDPEGPFKHQVTMCAAPIYGEVENARIYEWLEYHSALGANHFILYDAGGISSSLAAMLAPYVKKGMVEIMDCSKLLQYETWTRSQVVLGNDCSYRTRYTSKWTMFIDFDEYFYIADKTAKMGGFLDKFDSVPYVTFGSLWWSINLCRSTEGVDGAWPVEKMVFHWPTFYCVYQQKFPRFELCLDYWGHRKYAVNPRRVESFLIHRPGSPTEGGVDLDANIAVSNHYQGLVKKGRVLCNQTVEGPQEWWSESNEIRRLAKFAKRNPTVAPHSFSPRIYSLQQSDVGGRKMGIIKSKMHS